ncbi:MAG: sulfotransferase, partial [Myxococcota bacterium]
MPAMAEHPPVFIVGTGRCGSTLMSKLIHRHKDILSLSEVFTTFTTKAFVSRQLDGVAFWKML